MSLAIAAMLLVSPYSRKAHFVLLMLPMTFAYSRLALTEAWSYRERVLLVGFLISFVLTACTARGLVGKTGSLYLTAACSMGLGTLILFLTVLAYLGPRFFRRSPAEP